MIGVFDSGLGGLVILKELDKKFPEIDFLYLGDNARAPYGPKSKEEVFTFTLQAVEYLFAQGCELVILACNTASAQVLRRIQQEVLPVKYPDKKVLGILVPTIEQVTGRGWIPEIQTPASTGEQIEPVKSVAVFATNGTVNSGAYEMEIRKRQPSIEVFQVACGNLATMIEEGVDREIIRTEVLKHVGELKEKMGEVFPPEAVLLGCTHYPIIHDLFVDALPDGVHVYDQAKMVASSLENYLLRHSVIFEKLGKNSERRFLTTGEPRSLNGLASTFYGKEISYSHVDLG
jgi:glutamate racemase